MPVVYEELRRLAAQYLRRERPDLVARYREMMDLRDRRLADQLRDEFALPLKQRGFIMCHGLFQTCRAGFAGCKRDQRIADTVLDCGPFERNAVASASVSRPESWT